MEDRESGTCAGCMNKLEEQEYVSALGQDWHTECFRCCACDAALSSWYLEKDGLLFCQTDYWARYGECCRQCSQVITGPVMVAGDHRFHPECFTCAACCVFIEDGEPYALLERSKLYCGGCYKSLMQPLGCGRAAHSIRIVEMPPAGSADGQPHIRLAASDKRGPITADYACRGVTIQEMDSSCGLMTLHIGDRILEINGTPIRSQPIEEIERVLCCSDTVLQLTIEHDPDSSSFKPYQRCKLSIEEPKPIKHASDTKSRIERKHMKLDDVKKANIPVRHSEDKHSMEMDVNSNHRQVDMTDESSVILSETIERPIKMKCQVEEAQGRKERLFKRRGEGQNSGQGHRVVRRRQTPESPLLGEKERERSSSMSKLLDAVGAEEQSGVLNDLSRARSFRVDTSADQRVFRAADLLQGELLGCGFFGQVYKVTHRDTAEVMVLKQLYRVDEDAQRNFLKEVAVLRSLKHGNVLRFIGVLYKDKRLHLVTEYVAGGTLQQLLQDSSVTLCWAVRARLARDIAAGVGYLHRMNIIHRDLNSHNCLVREDKTVIVADFGLARIVQRTASSSADREQRSSTLNRRKRYTVVGNPYWMAPEMMKGNVYDEKVDVFSFGIILCEIIGRVQADPDYLPRRSDFGLNESLFRDKFCVGCPEPFCRLAFLCCDLNPDDRPPFEVIEIWLESLVMHLSVPGPLPPDLLADILSYRQHARHGHCTPVARGPTTPECCHYDHNTIFGTSKDGGCGSLENVEKRACCQRDLRAVCGGSCCPRAADDGGVRNGGAEINTLSKSKSKAAVPEPVTIHVEESIPERSGRALGKCVSAGQISQFQSPIVTITKLSRSQNTLNAPSGYILRAHGKNINITKVDDISEWVDPPTPLKRSSLTLKDPKPSTKTRKIDHPCRDHDSNLPSFLRNQSIEGLESESKNNVDLSQPFCRHYSIPDNCETKTNDSEGSDDDITCSWYQRVGGELSVPRMDQPKIVDIVKSGKRFLNSDLDPENVELRHPLEAGTHERKIAEENCKRYNINHLRKSPGISEGIKHIQAKFNQSNQKPQEKMNFFTKKLVSPKLGRLFRPNTSEVDRTKPEEVKSPKLLSKFFIQRPASPSSLCKSSYRVRPVDAPHKGKIISEPKSSVLDTDVKLASLGKPMTPIFRRHIPSEDHRFQDGRYSCRDRRSTPDLKREPKFAELRKSRVVAPGTVLRVDAGELSPLARCSNTSNIPALATAAFDTSKAPSKDATDGNEKRKKDIAISRGNYVSLANLKINCKPKDLEKGKVQPKTVKSPTTVKVPVERVI